jgi:hypothetical protein
MSLEIAPHRIPTKSATAPGRRKGMTILREGGGDATILDHSKSQNWDSAAIQVRCSARAKLGYGRIAVDVIWITDEQRPFMPAKASTNHKLNILRS